MVCIDDLFFRKKKLNGYTFYSFLYCLRPEKNQKNLVRVCVELRRILSDPTQNSMPYFRSSVTASSGFSATYKITFKIYGNLKIEVY